MCHLGHTIQKNDLSTYVIRFHKAERRLARGGGGVGEGGKRGGGGGGKEAAAV